MAEKIAVLMGGRSLEREVSLKSGERVVAALQGRGYPVVALDLVPQLVDSLRSEKPQAVYVALHGKLGEDGVIQELLEFLRIPYTGSGVLASMLTWDKDLSKRLFLENGIPTPAWVAFSASAFKEMGAARALDLIAEQTGGFPVAVKPASQGSALGLRRVEDPSGLADAILNAFAYDSKVMVEKWVGGTEIAISVIDGPEGPEALPAVEIVPKSGIYDYDAKYTPDATDYFIPVRLPAEQVERAASIAREVYRVLGCRDLSRIDAVIDEHGRTQVLECSTLPGLTETSVLAMSAEAAGIGFDDLVERQIRAALTR